MHRTHFLRKSVAFLSIAGALGAVPYSQADETGLPLHGFADVGLGYSSNNTPHNQFLKAFTLGTIDLYLNPEFGDNVKSLLEIAFEPEAETGAYIFDIERIQMGYTFSDLLTIWAGRFHTPYGYWNTAFHHGAQIQTSIYRPRFLDFEDLGGVIPAHSVGFWFTGRQRVGEGKVGYDAYVTNGARIVANDQGQPDHLDMNMVRNDKSRYTFGGRAYYEFGGGLEGLTLGGHGLVSPELNAYGADDLLLNATSVRMFGGFALYEAYGVEYLAEYYRFSNKDLAVADAASIGSGAGYAQIGYSVTENLKPFFRYEKTSLDQTDNFFSSQVSGDSYTRYAVGFRYDLNPKAALKFEFMNTDAGDRVAENFNIGKLQYAVRF